MKRLLLSLAFLLGLTTFASAQCVGVGGINNVPQPGLNCQQDSIVPTYVATGIGIIPAAAPTDIACLTGSATKTVRVKYVTVSGTAGTAINIVAALHKHASADTGGTKGTSLLVPVPYKMDSSFAAPTATAASYTANPTINDATPGVISAKTVFLPATGTAVAGGATEWFFNAEGFSPPVLRGVAQEICVNLAGVTTPSSGLMTVSFIWAEY